MGVVAHAHQGGDRPTQAGEYPAALGTETDVRFEALAVVAVQLAVEVVGEVRVRPAVLAHEAASLPERADGALERFAQVAVLGAPLGALAAVGRVDWPLVE
jgi:hypothetical protein